MHERAHSIRTSQRRTASRESLFWGSRFSNKRSLICCSYYPSEENIKAHLETLPTNLAYITQATIVM